MRANPKVAIFDLDGTLTDSEEGIVASFRHSLSKFDLPADNGTIRHQIGPPLAEGFAALGVPEGQLSLAVETYRAHFSRSGIFQNRLYDGVKEMLVTIKASGMILAVATSKLTGFAERIVDHFEIGALFSVVAGASEDGVLLAKGEIVADALRRLDHPDPTTVLMIGDRAQDIQAAISHGLLPIGVTWGYGTEIELLQAGAPHLVATPLELARLVL